MLRQNCLLWCKLPVRGKTPQQHCCTLREHKKCFLGFSGTHFVLFRVSGKMSEHFGNMTTCRHNVLVRRRAFRQFEGFEMVPEYFESSVTFPRVAHSNVFSYICLEHFSDVRVFRCVRSYRYRATERPVQCDHRVEEASVAFGLPFHSQEWSISDFPCCLTRNITSHSMKNLAFQSLLRWKMIILLILTTSLIHLSGLKVGRMYFVNLGVKGLMRVVWI